MENVNYLIAYLLVWIFIAVNVAEDKIKLDGQWKYANQNGSLSGSGTVPGSIYTDLMRNKVLRDPYYRYNDEAYRWVSKDNWTYTTTFNVTSDMLQKSSLELWVGGIDTISTIKINNKAIGKTDNMFRRYIFDVKSAIKSGENSISVGLSSAVYYALSQAAAYPYNVPPGCPADVQHGECHFNFIRKSAASFSWDWGPAFPTQGIWRNMTLLSYNTLTIDYVTPETMRDASGLADADWILKVKVFFKMAGSGAQSGSLLLALPDLGVREEMTVTITQADPTYTFTVAIGKSKNVEPWWPNGHGNQKMYGMSVTWSSSSNTEKSMRMSKTGFRTVELVENTLSSGLTFFFRINGKPIFMKGSNWIPADSFQERNTPDYLHKLLFSAKEANMNMLRVWGGGIYESEAFYELTDSLGIMIWQDFMYACALYPSNDGFLDNVREEATHQVRRLKRHPSIAIWAGNNENEGALRDNWYHFPKEQYPRYYKDYIKLYIDTIRTVVLQEDTSRPFVPSSPSNGRETQKEGWVAKNPGDSHYGDVHHYDYSSDNWDWKVYPITRFSSEFGFESWTSFETIQKVSNFNDWEWNGTFAEWRQHHGSGNQQMYDEASKHITMPTTTDKSKFFEYFIYITQINQAVGIKTEAELCLRRQSFLNDQGDGYTMGSLYWQLEDIWQAPTWASIEYGGKWKMLHYYAKKFYNKTILSPERDGDMLKVYYIDDDLPPFDGAVAVASDRKQNQVVIDKDSSVVQMDQASYNSIAEDNVSYILQIKAYAWSSLKPRKIWNHPVTPKPSKGSTIIYTGSMNNLLSEAGCDALSCFFYFTMYYNKEMSLEGPSNWQLASYFNQAKGLKKASISVENIEQVDPHTFSFTLKTDNIAPFVYLEAVGMDGYFSDNGFIMVEQQRNMYYYAWPDTYWFKDFMYAIRVLSLMDMYPE